MLTAPFYSWRGIDRRTRFLDTSSLTPREMLKGHAIVYYSPLSLDYEPVGEPERDPMHLGQIYYVAVLTAGARFSVLNSRDVMPEHIANARWRNSKSSEQESFATADRWSRAYVIERAATILSTPNAKDIFDLPPNWAFRMGIRPLLLEGRNRDALLGLEAQEDRLPSPQELAPVVRGIVATALRRSGYDIDSVSVPDTIYAIRDSAHPELVKIGCGTYTDRPLNSEIGCQSRLEEAKRWTAGRAEFVAGPLQVGAGLGEVAEAFVHDELIKRGSHVYGEWFRVPEREVERLFIRAHTEVTAGR